MFKIIYIQNNFKFLTDMHKKKTPVIAYVMAIKSFSNK